uniref:Citramalyl-CoA lyase, mitochondrial n=1 Tax=Rhipicephalus appendiculatus TaxID=34631 RepID=A0A131Z1N2_RHIAP
MSSSLITWAALRRTHGIRKLLQKAQVPCGSPTLRHYTPRRAVLYVPGSDERKITKAFGLDADCMVLDCEDGVAANKKKEARETVARVLDKGERPQGCRDLAVRINAVSTGLAEDDIRCLLGASHLPNTMLVPKVEEIKQLDWVRDQVERALGKRQHQLELIVCIETALGLLNCHQLLQHASSMTHSRLQLAGLLFGSDDFTASIGARRTPEATEVLMARQQLVVLAKAYGLQAIDMVTIDLKNEELLRRQCAEGAAMGFTGKQVIHPSQIAPTQEAFAPTPAQLDRAQRLVKEFHQHQQEGKGAFVFEGSMIDMPSVRQALNIVEADQAIHGKLSQGK